MIQQGKCLSSTEFQGRDTSWCKETRSSPCSFPGQGDGQTSGMFLCIPGSWNWGGNVKFSAFWCYQPPFQTIRIYLSSDDPPEWMDLWWSPEKQGDGVNMLYILACAGWHPPHMLGSDPGTNCPSILSVTIYWAYEADLMEDSGWGMLPVCRSSQPNKGAKSSQGIVEGA